MAAVANRHSLGDWVRTYEARTERHGGFEKQVTFVRDPRRVCIAAGAVRTGKTYGASEKFLLRVVRDRTKFKGKEPLLYWAIAPTYAQGIAQKIEISKRVADKEIDWGRQGNDMRFRDFKRGGGVLCLKGNVTIEFKSAGDEEALVARKVRGVWVTEAARCKWTALGNLRTRISNYDDGWLIFDTSPMGHNAFFEHWIRKSIEPALHEDEAEAKEWESQVGYHHWTAMDSPFLSKAEVEHARLTLPWLHFKRDYLASWDSFRGQIYSEFDEETHLRDFSPNGPPSRVVIGVDVNTSDTAPASFGVFEVNESMRPKRAHLASEYYRYGLGLDIDGYARAIHSAAMQYHCPVTIVYDPSAKLLGHKLRQHNPENSRTTIRKALNAVSDGILCVATALHVDDNRDPVLTINRECDNWINEVRGYSWETTSGGVVTERPSKVADHLMDATRYAAMEIWGRSWGVRNL